MDAEPLPGPKGGAAEAPVSGDLPPPRAAQPSIRFDLRFTRATHEAATATLTFKGGPASNEPTALVFQMREIDLQAPFLGTRPPSEYFEDEAGPVQNLGLERLFKVALLYRRELMIDNHQLRMLIFDARSDLFNLARTKERARTRRVDSRGFRMDHIKLDGRSQADSFLKPRFWCQRYCVRVAVFPAFLEVARQHRHDDNGFGTAGILSRQ